MKLAVMERGQECAAIELVKEVFDEVIACDYTQEGVENFYHFANVKKLIERSESDHFTILAQNNGKIFGLIEIRSLSHVSMFFVRSACQNMGVGTSLFNGAVAHIKKQNPNINELTVNSSLHAVPVYETLGFVVQDGEQCLDGIVFIPMKLNFEPYASDRAK